MLNTDQTVEQAAKAAGADVVGFSRLLVGKASRRWSRTTRREVAKAMTGLNLRATGSTNDPPQGGFSFLGHPPRAACAGNARWAAWHRLEFRAVACRPEPAMPQLAYRRVLLKLSGEALMGDGTTASTQVIGRLAREVIEARDAGAEVALVIGGGNIFRGAGLGAGGMDRVTGDQMGMLATVINALAMQEALEKLGAKCRVMSAIKINDVCEDYIRRRAVRHLEKGRITIFAAGTGNPFFTTDSGAALRAIEIGADLLLKATKVDGVYDRDPKKHADAVKLDTLTYDDVIARNLQVMDTAAFALCRDAGLPLRIFDMAQPGVLLRILHGEPIGTLVHASRSRRPAPAIVSAPAGMAGAHRHARPCHAHDGTRALPGSP